MRKLWKITLFSQEGLRFTSVRKATRSDECFASRFSSVRKPPNLTRVPSGRDRVRQLRQQRQQLGRTPPGQQLRRSFRQVQELLLQRTWHRVQRKVWKISALYTLLPLTWCCWLSLAVLVPSVKPQQTMHCFEIRPLLMYLRLSQSMQANTLMLTFACVQIRARRLQR